MNSKLFLVFAVLLIFSNTGNALKCEVCKGDSEENCKGKAVTCPAQTKYCYSASYTQKDGKKVVERGCDTKYCPDAAATCRDEIKDHGLKSCSGSCCSSDDCNSGTSIMAAKFSICFLIIMGYFFA